MKRVIMGSVLAMVVAACGQSVFDLEVGMCFDGAIDAATTVEIADCAEEHQSEVFALFEYLEVEAYPGETEMAAYAQEVCIPAFQDYVGIAYGESALFATSGFPSTGTWADGDRQIVCSLTAENGTLTGSMRGANR
jgi:hypothetical protein